MNIARSQYDERVALASDISFEGDRGVTKQADLKDTDINALFKRFEKTGQLPDMIAREGRYGDFSEVPDFQEALGIVRLANEQFEALDASLRNRFENDPAKFLAFATDAKNEDEMAKLGLLNKEAMDRRAAKSLAEAEAVRQASIAKNAADEQALIAKIKAELNK